VTVYLLHFDKPLEGSNRPQHYLGWTAKLRERMEYHAAYGGACIIRNGFRPRGIGFSLARTWPGAGRGVERWIKLHYRNLRILCPMCCPSTTRALHISGLIEWGANVYRAEWHRPRVRRPGLRFRSGA
jgi:hypothetical protein